MHGRAIPTPGARPASALAILALLDGVDLAALGR
jgi:hypothetical protein